MKILITGITGQDGRLLAQYLLEEGHEVHGLLRPRTQGFPSIDAKLHFLDITDYEGLRTLFDTHHFHEIYNLAAQSNVGQSFHHHAYTIAVNAIGAMNIMNLADSTPVYQASTSEMFGHQSNEDGRISEDTPMIPHSPYGIAKLAAHNAVYMGRRGYGRPHYAGILFNHESAYRGDEFLTKKVVNHVVRTPKEVLALGNLDSSRDWGSAEEYVKAMPLILRVKRGDYVVATGKAHTVREWIEACFEVIGEEVTWDGDIGYTKAGRVCVSGGKSKFVRPLDIDYLCGDPTLIQNDLGWRARVGLKELAAQMIEGVK